MSLDFLKILPHYLLPQQGLTWLLGRIANSTNVTVKHWLIKNFVRYYKVDMQLAMQPDITQYATFNDFFTRKLKPELRPIAAGKQDIASPVDGGISQLSEIKTGNIFNAKGRYFTLQQLLGDTLACNTPFTQGSYISLYLSPRDYHRIHMPVSGRLSEMVYIPGKLFSVSNSTLQAIPDVFAQNERAVLVFETTYGPMIMILVGAMIVASINTVWHGEIKRETSIRHWHYPKHGDGVIELAKGVEVGSFKLGSTVILLFPDPDAIQWESKLKYNVAIQYGEKIATYRLNTPVLM